MNDEYGIVGKIEVCLGNLTKSVDRMVAENERSRMALLAEWPRVMRFHGVVTAPASGFAVFQLDLPGPDRGHFWYVHRIAIGGLTPTTTAAGRLDVFVSGEDLSSRTSLAQLGLADWNDSANALPLVGHYSDGELPIRSPEKLWCVLSGATSGQQYVVAGNVTDYQEGISPNVLGF